jgi:hypothetical protein
MEQCGKKGTEDGKEHSGKNGTIREETSQEWNKCRMSKIVQEKRIHWRKDQIVLY